MFYYITDDISGSTAELDGISADVSSAAVDGVVSLSNETNSQLNSQIHQKTITHS
jgi:hypothetical protein